MNLFEQNNKRIPKYYNTMYLDDFTPEEIMMAKRRQMWGEFLEPQEPTIDEAILEKSVQKALDKTMGELFKRWK